MATKPASSWYRVVGVNKAGGEMCLRYLATSAENAVEQLRRDRAPYLQKLKVISVTKEK